uniref:Uncharacterized protein n=1 Tax=Cacopsylla melanoneura TaxID=428564 RepID=A0A8D9B5C1_9HEMI
MYRVVVPLQNGTFFNSNLVEKVPDFVRVARGKDMPQCPGQFPLHSYSTPSQNITATLVYSTIRLSHVFALVPILRYSHIDHEIDRITNVQVKVSCGFGRVEGVPVGNVHLGSQVRLDETLWQTRGKVEATGALRVLAQWEYTH